MEDLREEEELEQAGLEHVQECLQQQAPGLEEAREVQQVATHFYNKPLSMPKQTMGAAPGERGFA